MIEVSNWKGLCQITLNRPEKANSLTAQMLTDLVRAVGEIDQNTNAMVITGTGKVFSAGADLDEAKKGLATSDLWEELSGAIADLPCLTIAALNGTLAGGAFGMALACDIRVTVENANFFYPVMKLGYLPQPSDPARLRQLVGPARAKMVLMSGQKIDAAEALSWGLVDRKVPTTELQDAVESIVSDALVATPEHVGAIKNMLR